MFFSLFIGPSSLVDEDQTSPKRRASKKKVTVASAQSGNEENLPPRDANVALPEVPHASDTLSEHSLPSSSASASSERTEFCREGRETFEARQREVVKRIQNLRAKLASSSSVTRVATSSVGVDVPEGVDIGGGGDGAMTFGNGQSKSPFTPAFPSPYTFVGGGDG